MATLCPTIFCISKGLTIGLLTTWKNPFINGEDISLIFICPSNLHYLKIMYMFLILNKYSCLIDLHVIIFHGSGSIYTTRNSLSQITCKMCLCIPNMTDTAIPNVKKQRNGTLAFKAVEFNTASISIHISNALRKLPALLISVYLIKFSHMYNIKHLLCIWRNITWIYDDVMITWKVPLLLYDCTALAACGKETYWISQPDM